MTDDELRAEHRARMLERYKNDPMLPTVLVVLPSVDIAFYRQLRKVQEARLS